MLMWLFHPNLIEILKFKFFSKKFKKKLGHHKKIPRFSSNIFSKLGVMANFIIYFYINLSKNAVNLKEIDLNCGKKSK